MTTRVVFGEARTADIYYRCGWASDAPCLYVEDDEKQVLYVAGFEYARACKEVSGVEVQRLTSPQEVLEALEGRVVVNWDFPYRLATSLRGEVTSQRAVFAERAVKSKQEITCLAHAQELAKQAMDLVESQLRAAEIIDGVACVNGEELTSEQLKMLVRTFLIQQGADCPDLIISSGSQTSLAHHRGSGPIKEGPVIIDIFPQASNRYHGDLTRTVLVGTHPRAQELLAAVREVHALCVQKCVPGQELEELHVFAEEELATRGFATSSDRSEGLVHSLGHGVGLQIHEAPHIGPRTEGVLEAGMVVTIEPGLYYEVGVRWEDAVVVGDRPRVL